MFCTKCGARNDETARNCTVCGGALIATPGAATPSDVWQPLERPYVPTYLAQAILVTLFCCLPFGIPAIVYAAQIGSKLASGDYAGAVHSSKQAKMWCWIGFGCGLVWIILYLLSVAVFVLLPAVKPR